MSATRARAARALAGVAVLGVFGGGLSAGALIHPEREHAALVASSFGEPGLASFDSGGAPPVVTPVAEPPAPPSAAPPAASAGVPPAAAPSRPVHVTQAPVSTPTERIAAAMARISYPWQQLGYRIVFEGPVPGMAGRTSPRSMGTIEIYVRPDETVDMLAHVIAHEIGHAVDLTYGNDQRRSVWLQLRGVSPRPWFTCSMCEDFSTPAGDFAETFAYWQLHDFSRSLLAPPPTVDQLAQLSPLFGSP
ncbi:MAG: hypothetical protein JO155_06465 [Acidimicrobiia bacterium]|nr:hypothetical protein [Acidimicrobiia bacterium]